jgi:hypothetical protein
MLGTTLFTLLLAALAGVGEPMTDPRVRMGRTAVAGLLFGLLYLTLYSSLILLVPVLVYLYQVTRRDARVLGVFLAAAFLNPLTAFFLFRTAALTSNPFFNLRLFELVMHTDSYPGYSLYRAVGMQQTLPEFLADGGIGEIVGKMGRNLLGYYTQLPVAFGVLLLPLFLAAALTRFGATPLNRLRNLVYASIGVHVLGLSLFMPYQEGMSLLVIYLPFVAVLGTTFLKNHLRFRNLPSFYARATVAGWVALAAVPGFLLFMGQGKTLTEPYRLFDALNGSSREMQTVRSRPGSLLASDAPWEVAYYTGVPTVWLPNNSSEFQAAEARSGRMVSGLFLTPGLETPYNQDAEATPWRMVYARISALMTMARTLGETDRNALLQKTAGATPAALYPQEIIGAMTDYKLASPVNESGVSRFSFLLWNPRADLIPAAGATVTSRR